MLSVSEDKAQALTAARRRLHAANDNRAIPPSIMVQSELWADDEIVLVATPAPPKHVSRRRREIFDQSDGICHYCRAPLKLDGKWHVEHWLLGTLNQYSNQNLQNGTTAQNTPFNYYQQFSNMANSLGQGYGTSTGSTSGGGSSPITSALGGAQLGSSLWNRYSSGGLSAYDFGFNGQSNPSTRASADMQTQQIKELESPDGKWMDTRAPRSTVRADQKLASVRQGNRTQEPRGKARVSRNAFTGGNWQTMRALTKATNQMLREHRQAVGQVVG